jgi:hypothetical protein
MQFLLTIMFFFSSQQRVLTSPVINSCRASTAWSTSKINYFQAIVTGTDARNTTFRQAYDLPYVTTSPAVELISDETQCGNAVTALQALYADGKTHSPVFLIRIGTTRFAIADGSLSVHIFDSNYQYKFSMRALD